MGGNLGGSAPDGQAAQGAGPAGAATNPWVAPPAPAFAPNPFAGVGAAGPSGPVGVGEQVAAAVAQGYAGRAVAWAGGKASLLTGDALAYLLCVTPTGVRRRAARLLFPWPHSDWRRRPDGGGDAAGNASGVHGAGLHPYLSPALDPNAPELFLPLVSAGALIVAGAARRAAAGAFAPEHVSSDATWAGVLWCLAWGGHAMALRARGSAAPAGLGELDRLAHGGGSPRGDYGGPGAGAPGPARPSEAWAHAGALFLFALVPTAAGLLSDGAWTPFVLGWAYGSACAFRHALRALEASAAAAGAPRAGAGGRLAALGLAAAQPLLVWTAAVKPSWGGG